MSITITCDSHAYYPNINSVGRKKGKTAAEWYYLQSHICNFHKVSSAVSFICYGTHIHCRTLIHIFIYLHSFSLLFYVLFFQDHITNCLTWRAEYNRQNCYIDFFFLCCAASQFFNFFFLALYSSFTKLSMNKWILSILIRFSIGGFYGVLKITFL